MTVTVNEAGKIKCNCSICGAVVWRKYRKEYFSCAECKRKNKQDYQEMLKHQPRKPMGRPPKHTPTCEHCKYIRLCKQDLWRLDYSIGEGLIMIPLRCFADHPAYNPAEWKLRRQDGIRT